jgi:hypothetical protein
MMEAKIQSDELLRNKLYRGAVRREQQMTAGWYDCLHTPAPLD